MIQNHEAQRIYRKLENNEPLDSYDANSIQLYEIAGFHPGVEDKHRKAVLAARKLTQHPPTPEQSLPPAHHCAMQMDLLMHPLQEAGT